jgi:hypothetical protein
MRNIFEAAIKANGLVKGIMVKTTTVDEMIKVVQMMDDATENTGTPEDTFKFIKTNLIDSEPYFLQEIYQFINGEESRLFKPGQILVIEGEMEERSFSTKLFHADDKTKVNNGVLTNCLPIVNNILSSSLTDEEKSLLIRSLDTAEELIQHLKK